MGTPEPQKFLATHVLNDEKIIHYREVARTLRVRYDVAKKMMNDFHTSQNARRPGSVHANYLVFTRQHIPAMSQAYEEDVPMGDVDLEEWGIPQLSIALVPEERLKAMKAENESIEYQIHSLAPSAINDCQNLCFNGSLNQRTEAHPNPLENTEFYGLIVNPNAKWRNIPLVERSLKEYRRAKPDPKPKSSEIRLKGEDISNKAPPPVPKPLIFAKKPATKQVPTKPAPLKRGSSDIFKSFAKAKPKKTEESGGSAAAKPAPVKQEEELDILMKESSESEDEDSPQDETVAIDNTNRRADQREKVRQMMEDDEGSQEKLEEPMAVDEPDEPEEKEEEEPPPVVVTNGRRRGKRKVMKKKTTQDAEGYLITKEEPAWESFSEDEAPPPPRPKMAPLKKGAQGSKGKSGGGNIMSFFGKK